VTASTSPVPALDVARVREQFSSLSRRVGSAPARFFDGAGGSQVPDVVIDAIADYMRHHNANEGGAFETSRETGEVLVQAHAAIADLLGVSDEQVAFGANMTTLNFALTRALARTLSEGDEIVVTALDHEGNISPWLLAAADFGLVVRTAPVQPDGTLDVDALEALIGPRTKVVAFTLASNLLGTVPDAVRIAAAARAAGALSWVDAVHMAPHRRPDVAALGVDVLLCSPYKFFGPHAGVAVLRRDLAETLPADRVRPAGETPAAHRFETGTLNHEALAGVVAAVDYLAGLGAGGTRPERLASAFAAIRAYEDQLTERFLTGLAGLPGVRLYGLADPARIAERTPTFLLRVEGETPEQTSDRLGRQGFFTWDGNMFAPGAVEAIGLDEAGGTRVSFLHYNTAQEVDDLLAVLA
jgi:cysteine desulfurase family protein (TIGR01976 family)